MRFRPANIRLINRRSKLPRLLPALSSKNGKSNDKDKNNTTIVQGLTGHSISEPLLTFPRPALGAKVNNRFQGSGQRSHSDQMVSTVAWVTAEAPTRRCSRHARP